MSPIKTYVIIPVANEEGSISATIQGILKNDIAGLKAVFVMDRYSTDRTAEIIEKAQSADPRVSRLYYKESRGVVSAYLFGLKYAINAGADYIIDMDAGGSHDPAELGNFIRHLDDGYDCVFGSRFMKGGRIEGHPLYRVLLSRSSSLLANLVLGTRFTDMTSGYEAFRRQALEKIDLDSFLSIPTTHFFHIEMRYYCSGLRVCEVPITYRGSKSVLKLRSLFKCLEVLFALRRKKKPGKTDNKLKRWLI